MTPVQLRGLIYMLLAGLPVFIVFFTGLAEKVNAGLPVSVHWVIWVLLSLNAAYQMILALRAYIDGSNERARQKDKPPTKDTP